MNFLKKGPELKVSEIKVPGFVQDIYYDLKDRHLLPVAIVLVVAIFAVPIALSQSSGSDEAGSAEAGLSAPTPETTGAQAKELVSKAQPGLRDYRRRLKRLRAKDPFIQQYTGSQSEAGENTDTSSEATTEGSSSTPGSIEEGPTFSPSPSTGETETEAPDEPNPERLTYYSYAIDVRVSTGGAQKNGGLEASGKSEQEPTVRRNLPELTMLPSRKTPALIYMGSTKDGKKALMLVSSDVNSIFGDAKCVLGSETCELLAMEPGLPETIVYGGSGKTYKIELIKIHLVKTKDLNRAPLGEPRNSKTGSQPKQHAAG